MTPVVVSVPHQLGREEARRRIDEGFGQVRQQVSSGMGAMMAWDQRWEDDRLLFEAKGLGQQLQGRIEVMEDSVRIEIDLPKILAGLAQRIVGRLQDTGRKLLEKR